MKRFANWKSVLTVTAIQFLVFADPIVTFACGGAVSGIGGC